MTTQFYVLDNHGYEYAAVYEYQDISGVTHFGVRSGLIGCLPQYATEEIETYQEAVEALRWVVEELYDQDFALDKLIPGV